MNRRDLRNAGDFDVIEFEFEEELIWNVMNHLHTGLMVPMKAQEVIEKHRPMDLPALSPEFLLLQSLSKQQKGMDSQLVVTTCPFTRLEYFCETETE